MSAKKNGVAHVLKFSAKELWRVGADFRRKAPNAPPFVEWENLFDYNKAGWRAVARYVNARAIGITPRKERK